MITRKILVLFGLAFLATLGYGIMIPTLSVHAHELGASGTAIGVIVSAFAAAQLLTQIPMGRLSDRIGRVYLVVFGFGLMATAATLYHFATTANEFIVLQALAGVGGGCLWPSLMAMITENVEPAERGRLMGVFNTVFFLGVGMGPLIGGLIAGQWGRVAVFNAWTLVAVLGGFICMLAIKETHTPARYQGRGCAHDQAWHAYDVHRGTGGAFARGCVFQF
jgi:MFS transporter, DHA1 family, multidrug resistance protein